MQTTLPPKPLLLLLPIKAHQNEMPSETPIKILPVSSTTILPFNNQCIEIPITIHTAKSKIHTTTMIEMGAAGNFIDDVFAKENSIFISNHLQKLSQR